jgi:hypothetical protein
LSNGVPSSALASFKSAINARVPTIDQTRRAPRQCPETQLGTHFLRDRVLHRTTDPAFGLIRFNYAEATSNTNFIKYPMNRALHGLLGEKKLSGDFLTRHPASICGVAAVLVESAPLFGAAGRWLAPRRTMRNNRRTPGRIWPARVFVSPRMRDLTSLKVPPF